MKYDIDAQGNITKFELIQTPYNLENIPENRLRIQKFNVAALDENMKVV